MYTGAAGHVMAETLFLTVKLEHAGAPSNFVAANGERIRDTGGTQSHSKQRKALVEASNSGARACLISMRKVSAGLQRCCDG